jgi:hypothetical protein
MKFMGETNNLEITFTSNDFDLIYSGMKYSQHNEQKYLFGWFWSFYDIVSRLKRTEPGYNERFLCMHFQNKL